MTNQYDVDQSVAPRIQRERNPAMPVVIVGGDLSAGGVTEQMLQDQTDAIVAAENAQTTQIVDAIKAGELISYQVSAHTAPITYDENTLKSLSVLFYEDGGINGVDYRLGTTWAVSAAQGQFLPDEYEVTGTDFRVTKGVLA